MSWMSCLLQKFLEPSEMSMFPEARGNVVATAWTSCPFCELSLPSIPNAFRAGKHTQDGPKPRCSWKKSLFRQTLSFSTVPMVMTWQAGPPGPPGHARNVWTSRRLGMNSFLVREISSDGALLVQLDNSKSFFASHQEAVTERRPLI